MKYPLDALLKVRKMREDSANRELVNKKNLLEEAKRNLTQKKQEVIDFRLWRINREDELYAEVKNQKVSLKDLDHLKQHVLELRARELNLESQIKKAEKAVKKAEQELEKAKIAYNSATKDRGKIDEHKDIWVQDKKKELEREAEKEMEDFRVIKKI